MDTLKIVLGILLMILGISIGTVAITYSLSNKSLTTNNCKGNNNDN